MKNPKRRLLYELLIEPFTELCRNVMRKYSQVADNDENLKRRIRQSRKKREEKAFGTNHRRAVALRLRPV
jgi:hypothetical protein